MRTVLKREIENLQSNISAPQPFELVLSGLLNVVWQFWKFLQDPDLFHAARCRSPSGGARAHAKTKLFLCMGSDPDGVNNYMHLDSLTVHHVLLINSNNKHMDFFVPGFE